MTCFIYRETGSEICSGHCGLCADQEEGPAPSPRDMEDEGDV